MILCIETSTTVCSVALTDNNLVLDFREVNEGFNHAEKLTVFISEVLQSASVNIKDLDAVAVSSGPGSYTGLRIGVSVAKGICFAIDKPLISISTLELMALIASKNIKEKILNQLFCPMIDARRMEVYCALYDKDLNCISPPTAVIVTDEFFYDKSNKNSIAFFGDGAEKCRAVFKDNFVFIPDIFPSAKFMAELATNKFEARQFENLAMFEPFYLKEFVPGVQKKN
jgi:tRNA threonylcarbamoyladenosine biosynthesis protein TsaB